VSELSYAPVSISRRQSSARTVSARDVQRADDLAFQAASLASKAAKLPGPGEFGLEG